MKPTVIRTLPASAPKAALSVRSVVTAMSGSVWFPSPAPPLDQVISDVTALEAAEAERLTRAMGTRATRDALLVVVRNDFRQLAAYVEATAEASPGNAEVIVASAGMDLKSPSLWSKPLFTVKDGPTEGSVRLVAKRQGDRDTYEYQYSPDGKTWIKAGQRLQSKMLLSGLTPGQPYDFRVRVGTKDGPGNWSDVVFHFVR
jgi:hypothetical protein